MSLRFLIFELFLLNLIFSYIIVLSKVHTLKKFQYSLISCLLRAPRFFLVAATTTTQIDKQSFIVVLILQLYDGFGVIISTYCLEVNDNVASPYCLRIAWVMSCVFTCFCMRRGKIVTRVPSLPWLIWGCSFHCYPQKIYGGWPPIQHNFSCHGHESGTQKNAGETPHTNPVWNLQIFV